MHKLVLPARDECIGEDDGAGRLDFGCFLRVAVHAAELGGALAVGGGGEGVHLADEGALRVVKGVGEAVGDAADKDVACVGTAAEGESNWLGVMSMLTMKTKGERGLPIVDDVDNVVVEADDVLVRSGIRRLQH